jgi:hypothetical protein
MARIQKSKTSRILHALNKMELKKKIGKTGFPPLTRGMHKIYKIDKKIARAFLFTIPKSEFIEKATKCGAFSKLASSIHELDIIDTRTANQVYVAVPKEEIIQKLEEEKFKFEVLGVSLDYLQKVNSPLTKKIISNSQVYQKADEIGKSIKKDRFQAFLHYLPFISRADFKLACDIVGYTDRKFLTDLYTWKDLDRYTVNLLDLLEIYLKIDMQEDAKAVSKFILFNSVRLSKNYSPAEVAGIKKRLKKVDAGETIVNTKNDL